MDLLTSTQRSGWIELTGAWRENGAMYAVFRAGPSQRILCVAARDLQSFAAFQRGTVRALGQSVRHVSECELTPKVRAAAWAAAAQRALARGS